MLRKQKLQFMLNIEIGNITLGSAACCQTKDSLDGVELGQLNSYLTGIKWVSPVGDAGGGVRDARIRSCSRTSGPATGSPGSSTR